MYLFSFFFFLFSKKKYHGSSKSNFIFRSIASRWLQWIFHSMNRYSNIINFKDEHPKNVRMLYFSCLRMPLAFVGHCAVVFHAIILHISKIPFIWALKKMKMCWCKILKFRSWNILFFGVFICMCSFFLRLASFENNFKRMCSQWIWKNLWTCSVANAIQNVTETKGKETLRVELMCRDKMLRKNMPKPLEANS